MSLPEVEVDCLQPAHDFFAAKGWTAFPFQQQAWSSYLNGESGLIHVPTGSGKTFAAYFGPLLEMIHAKVTSRSKVQMIYLTPIKALGSDILKALTEPLAFLNVELKVESRTGDTSSSIKARQKKTPPQILITTPESLSLLLTQHDAAEYFSDLKSIVIDEWHELVASKRGTQTELAVARLRGFSKNLKVWAVSATVANLTEVAQAAVGLGVVPKIVDAKIQKKIFIDSIIPKKIQDVPWAGHLGLYCLDQVLEVLNAERSSILFTNTRFQAERWYQALILSKPEWAHLMAIHHGSLETKQRQHVEAALKDGSLKIVVSTSSLDLGVDFSYVERVFQIGSPKRVSRVIQRAGRSGHSPAAPSRLTFIPTNALELIEVSAVRRAVRDGKIEPRTPIKNALDVLAQHLVTCAMGGGFRADGLYEEVRTSVAYATLTREDFDFTLSLVKEGGKLLAAYEDYRKIFEREGVYRVTTKKIAQLHRMNLGTIASSAEVQVKMLRGRSLGTVDESYVSRLQKGDTFVFAGKVLEFIQMTDAAALVRPSKKKITQIPKWQGTKLPLSDSLCGYVREVLGGQSYESLEAAGVAGISELDSDPELEAIRPILQIQEALSDIPKENELLLETCMTREGHHLFMYPFEGRMVHEGLASVLAYRFARMKKATFSLAVNDYGIEWVSTEPFPFESCLTSDIFDEKELIPDILASLNLTELGRRQFRDIARIAGLVFRNYPGNRKNVKQVQSSSSLLFDVFTNYDPGNLLLMQARKEVLEGQFESDRLYKVLARLKVCQFRWVNVQRPTPLGFPLMLERLSTRLSTESLTDRITKMKEHWVRDAG